MTFDLTFDLCPPDDLSSDLGPKSRGKSARSDQSGRVGMAGSPGRPHLIEISAASARHQEKQNNLVKCTAEFVHYKPMNVLHTLVSKAQCNDSF